MVANYIRLKGIDRKTYKVDGRSKKGLRVCLRKGESLRNAFAMPIKCTENGEA